MPEERPRALVFGEVADLYDARRPDYPDELFDLVLTLAGHSERARVLDVGCGTGKAAVGFARRGAAVVGVEPNEAMAAVARRHLGAFPGCTVVSSRFEDWDGRAGSADVVTAGQAWHWVDQDVGLATAARVLGPGGVLALFWNAPRPEGTNLFEEVAAAYGREVPELAEQGTVALRWSDDFIEQRQRLATTGIFAPAVRHTWDWTKDYTTTGYVELLQTHSDHRLLPPADLDRLLVAVAEVVDGAGGRITHGYRTHLVTAIRDGPG